VICGVNTTRLSAYLKASEKRARTSSLPRHVYARTNGTSRQSNPPRFLSTYTSASLPLYSMGKLSSSPLLRPSAWKLEPEPSTFAPSSAWSNKDMDPVPPDMRTWTTFNYVAYWISDAANASMWAFASSMLAIGLSWFVVLLSYAT